MLIESNEDFSRYSSTVTLNCNDSLSDVVNYIKNLPTSYSNSSGTLSISFIVDEYTDYEGDKFSELIEALTENSNFIKWSASDVKIYINIEKPEHELVIYDEELLVSELESYDIFEQFELVQSYFSLTTGKSNLPNQASLRVQLDSMCKSAVFPSEYQSIIEAYEGPIKDYLTFLRNLTCFCLLTMKVEHSDSELFVYISDTHIIEMSEIKNMSSMQIEALENVYEWVFEDESYSIKITILNKVLSVQANAISSLNDKLIPILKSNLTILLSDKFDAYIQAKNEILDFFHDLTNKLNSQIQ